MFEKSIWLPDTLFKVVIISFVRLANGLAFPMALQGRNVVLESKFGSPRIVNDGVTVAKEVDLEDAVENIGAKLVRQVGTLVLPVNST